MKYVAVSSTLVLMLLVAGCARKSEVSDADQKVAELEKQLEQAKQEAAVAKDQAAVPATPLASQTPAKPKKPPAPPPPKQYTIPAGTSIPVRTVAALSTKTAAAGMPFEATLTKALTVDGVVIAPAGATVTGVVTSSDPGGKVKGKASLGVALKSIASDHGPIAIQTGSHVAVAKGTVKKDVVRGGIMTGAGAAIGAIAGGGKGAAIGAIVGGGAGTATAMATKGDPAVIPAESALSFSLKAPVTVTLPQ